MAYRELLPHPALEPFVDRFWVRSGGGQGERARVLPDGCTDLLLNVSVGGRGFAVGTMTRAVLVEMPPDQTTVAVRFRPGGATPFLRIAASELTDLRVSLGDLKLGWLDGGHLAASGDPVAAVRALERSLLDRLPSVPLPDPRLAQAVRVFSASGPHSVERVARRLGLSRQYLGRVFRAQVGIGPKVLARIARIQRAVAWLQQPRRSTLADVAARAGFFDEAHMDRDFRELVGVTPRVAQSATGSLRPISSLFGAARALALGPVTYGGPVIPRK